MNFSISILNSSPYKIMEGCLKGKKCKNVFRNIIKNAFLEKFKTNKNKKKYSFILIKKQLLGFDSDWGKSP